MKLLYFAWLRQRLGVSEEDIETPAEVRDVASLRTWLAARQPEFAELLANRTLIRVAVNQEHASDDTPLTANDEVALFPPVTGG